jgi:ABC-2 type transport system permease protein
MSISRASVLVGHVVGSMIQTAIATAIVVAVALLIGFRPTTEPVQWLAAAGVIALTSLAITWLGIALGLAANSVETASNSPMFLTILPFLSSGFVPTGTMPEPLRLFADNQPFTPIIETLRGLLLGTPIGNSGLIAVAWCVAITILAFVWALRLYEGNPAKP